MNSPTSVASTEPADSKSATICTKCLPRARLDQQIVVHYWRPDPSLNVISLRTLRNEFLFVGCIALVVSALILACFIVERREKSAMVEAVRRRMLLDNGRRKAWHLHRVVRWLYRRVGAPTSQRPTTISSGRKRRQVGLGQELGRPRAMVGASFSSGAWPWPRDGDGLEARVARAHLGKRLGAQDVGVLAAHGQHRHMRERRELRPQLGRSAPSISEIALASLGS